MIGIDVTFIREDDAEVVVDNLMAKVNGPGQPSVEMFVFNIVKADAELAAIPKKIPDNTSAIADDDDNVSDLQLITHQIDSALQVRFAIYLQHAFREACRIRSGPGSLACCRYQSV